MNDEKKIKKDLKSQYQSELSDIRKRMIELRNNLKLSQKEFGERLDLRQSYISRLENGDIDIAIEILLAISKKFNVDLHELLIGVKYPISECSDDKIRRLELTIEALQDAILFSEKNNVSV